MKRTTGFTLLLAGFLPMLLAAGPASAVTGTAFHQFTYGSTWYLAPAYTYVKLCPISNTGAWAGQGYCYATVTDSYGNFTLSVPDGTYDPFVWNTGGTGAAFGSESSTAWGQAIAANGSSTLGTQLTVNGVYGSISLYAAALPNQPQAVYPAYGARQIPLSMTLKWTADHTGWPVAYDIYSHGAGAPELLVLSNLPCNKDASGNCTYAVSNLVPATLYYWRIVAKLDPLRPANTNPPSAYLYYTTSSGEFNFATQGTTYSLGTSNGHKVAADNCGGSVVAARGTTVGACETLKIIDLNGGAFVSGDSVYIQGYASPWYYTAQNGGGASLLANSQWGSTYETFTISKVSGGGTLQNGDAVSLQASNGNYCSAENGGGDVVNCDRSGLGPWETFTLGIMP